MSLDLSNILTKGLQANLSSTAVVDGTLRFTTDSKRLYLDAGSARLAISDVISGYTDAQLAALTSLIAGKLYVSSDTSRVYYSDGTNLTDVSRIIPVSTSTNADHYVWMGDSSGNGPKYNSAFAYNPSTKTLKAGDLRITQSEDSSTGVGTVNFYLD